MGANSISEANLPAKSVGWTPWTDSIAASTTITKTLSVGVGYTRGRWRCMPVTGAGPSGGADASSQAGYSGNILQSSSSTEPMAGEALNGAYSSMWSSTRNTYPAATRWSNGQVDIRLNKVYFDGAGNVAFEFRNTNTLSSRTLSATVMVDVW